MVAWERKYTEAVGYFFLPFSVGLVCNSTAVSSIAVLVMQNRTGQRSSPMRWEIRGFYKSSESQF